MGMPVEVHRLIIEDQDRPITLDLHSRLTVAWHDDAALRQSLVNDLIGGLGPGRDGVHVELTLGSGQPLVLFRAGGGPHLAIDTEQGRDVTPAFRGANGTVDLLSRLGLPPPAGLRALRLSGPELAAAAGMGPGDEQPLVNHLAALDQRLLWETADQVATAEERLDAAVGRQPSGEPADRAAALHRARGRQRAAQARRRVEAAARSHGSVLRLGGIVAGACAVVALLLLAFDGLLDDDGWTSKVLIILAALALGIALWDRRALLAARRNERKVLDELARSGVPAGSPVAGDDPGAKELLAAAAAYEPEVERWRLVSGGAPLEAARAVRSDVEQAARRREGSTNNGAAGPAASGAVGLLRGRVAALARVGVVGERLPLVLDDPGAGLDPADAERLLDEVERLAAHHQVVLVSGDADVLSWATARSADDRLALALLDSATHPQPV